MPKRKSVRSIKGRGKQIKRSKRSKILSQRKRRGRKTSQRKKVKAPLLIKAKENPIIAPLPENSWER